MSSVQYAVSLMMPINPGCSQLVGSVMSAAPAARAGIHETAEQAGRKVAGRITLDVYVAPPWINRRWRSVDVLASARTVHR